MNLVLANVSFGILVLSPLGWIFMASVIVLESAIVSRILFATWLHKKAALAVTVANIASGVAGFGLSLGLNGGWWLVVWIPWVSRKELHARYQLTSFMTYYLVAFVLSIAIEGCVEHAMLRRSVSPARVWRACILSNLASYILGSFALYSWSFGLWR